ncbi:Glycosyltransferase involved in cell wall bisynthesis [Selenomonas ruminantium]|uniref:Glycosyltransferase involved in cell wall bisynthesis n=1 Tax=Selenomonas ruminantium TaxID=971 RepID=A0A1I3EHA0_SELRU|nr:glycosyltransferase [Selenomonas ruminantium]SFH98365.1 Glycosyltransferase involved in cell wall bisynthesis [Selenomonas ruminantium]
MKILHICLCGPMTDGWSYQENVITKYQKKMDLDVTIIASKYVWNKKNQLVFFDRTNYVNDDGVKVVRINNAFHTNVLSKFKIYTGLYDNIEKIKPNVLFIHGASFLDTYTIVKYLRNNPDTKVYVDNHNDFSNSARNMLSKYILHKFLWRIMHRMLLPFTEKFYGVLPARVDFLVDVYGIPSQKTDLLVMGADDEAVRKGMGKKGDIRRKYRIKDTDFLVMTAGKIDLYKKQTLLLMKAVKAINRDNVKLIIFGNIDKKIENEFLKLCDNKLVKYIGWAEGNESYAFFSAADLVVFPGRHSVYWEQVVGIGVPMICKHWPGTTHVDIGGNIRFLNEDSPECIKKEILSLVDNPTEYEKMKMKANGKGKKRFLYSTIARQSIGYQNGDD